MSLDVKFSPLARNDLEGIYSYISDELSNPRAAKTTIGEILDRISLLARFPQSGTPPYPQFTQSKASIATFVREIILRFTVRQTQSTSTVSSMQKATI